MAAILEVFLCYAHKDDRLREKLAVYLRGLQRQGIFNVWYDREISAGAEWAREIDKHLNTAHIILLLISPDFMDSDYCNCVEVSQALKRHERGEARVIPVLLRPVYWGRAPFAKLLPLPKNGKPVIGTGWRSLDEALFDIAEGIRKVAEEMS